MKKSKKKTFAEELVYNVLQYCSDNIEKRPKDVCIFMKELCSFGIEKRPDINDTIDKLINNDYIELYRKFAMIVISIDDEEYEQRISKEPADYHSLDKTFKSIIDVITSMTISDIDKSGYCTIEMYNLRNILRGMIKRCKESL